MNLLLVGHVVLTLTIKLLVSSLLFSHFLWNSQPPADAATPTLATSTPWTTPPTPRARPSSCGVGSWEAFEGSCYLIPETSQRCVGKQPGCEEHFKCDPRKCWTWNCSRWECSHHHGAHLVTIDSRWELEFLQKRTQLGPYYFIGLSRTHERWSWISDKPLDQSIVPLLDSDSLQTSNNHCATIGYGNVSTAPCCGLHSWICEKGASGPRRLKTQTGP
ncbi:C-type lectin domain family 6 member A-like [Ornithorhynchus anatinus]|uniref:C-type lectin domain family 6 member A-like n=1 Tax=Ornithorhynchus anatinus TaxID=9258 RepID=UPI0010A8CA69|nr:C-type lectin domain family 6 member A-like [Ornithorhynchus anatinus]XP_039771010.1 C-type lectin domain family 6 member A-like [Ornithorhynchus anatinus]